MNEKLSNKQDFVWQSDFDYDYAVEIKDSTGMHDLNDWLDTFSYPYRTIITDNPDAITAFKCKRIIPKSLHLDKDDILNYEVQKGMVNFDNVVLLLVKKVRRRANISEETRERHRNAKAKCKLKTLNKVANLENWRLVQKRVRRMIHV